MKSPTGRLNNLGPEIQNLGPSPRNRSSLYGADFASLEQRVIAHMAKRYDEYLMRAKVCGVSAERAREILEEELRKAMVSPTMTTDDALEAARRRLSIK